MGAKLYVQEMMDGLPKPDKQGYSSIAEMMRDSECPIDKKLKLIGQIRGFVTINAITKDDLFEMLGVVYDLLKTRVAMKY